MRLVPRKEREARLRERQNPVGQDEGVRLIVQPQRRRIAPSNRPVLELDRDRWESIFSRHEEMAPTHERQRVQARTLLEGAIQAFGRYEQLRSTAIRRLSEVVASNRAAIAPLDGEIAKVRGNFESKQSELRGKEAECNRLVATSGLKGIPRDNISLEVVDEAINRHFGYDPDAQPPSPPARQKYGIIDWLAAIICGGIFGIAAMSLFLGMRFEHLQEPLNWKFLMSLIAGPAVFLVVGKVIEHLVSTYEHETNHFSETQGQSGKFAIILPMLIVCIAWLGDIGIEKQGLQKLIEEQVSAMMQRNPRAPIQMPSQVAFWGFATFFGSIYFALKFMTSSSYVRAVLKHGHDVREFTHEQERKRVRVQNELEVSKHLRNIRELAYETGTLREAANGFQQELDELNRRREDLNSDLPANPELEELDERMDQAHAEFMEAMTDIRQQLSTVPNLPEFERRGPGSLPGDRPR